MNFFSHLVKYFTNITTGIVFVFIAIQLIEGHDTLDTKTLIEIPCAAFATALVTAVIYAAEPKTTKALCIKIAVHYLILSIIMVILGNMFGWVDLDLAGILTMVITTAAVYIFTFAVSYISVKNESDKLNSALKRKRSEKT